MTAYSPPVHCRMVLNGKIGLRKGKVVVIDELMTMSMLTNSIKDFHEAEDGDENDYDDDESDNDINDDNS